MLQLRELLGDILWLELDRGSGYVIVVAALAALKIHVIVCLGRAGLQPRGCNTGWVFCEMLAFFPSCCPLPVTLIYAAQKSLSYALASYELLYLNLLLNICNVDTEHL